MHHQLICAAFLLACTSFSFPNAYAMEEDLDEDTEDSIFYRSPAQLGLSEVMGEDPPHTCAYCNIDLKFQDVDQSTAKESLNIIQDELIIDILKKLSLEDTLIYSAVSKRMYNLCQNSEIWQELACKEIPWQPQETLECVWFGFQPHQLNNTMLEQKILSNQKPVKGTSWTLKPIKCEYNEYNKECTTIFERTISPSSCIKNQILSDHLYYLNLFTLRDEETNNNPPDNIDEINNESFYICDIDGDSSPPYWVKASQLQPFLEKPCDTTWRPWPYENTQGEHEQTYHFSIGKNQFEVYVANVTKIPVIKEDIRFVLSALGNSDRNVFVEDRANIHIKKVEQEKKKRLSSG